MSPQGNNLGASQATGLAGAEALEPHSGLLPSDGIPRASFTSGPWQRRDEYDGALTIIGNVDADGHPDGTFTYSYDFIANCEDEYGEPASAANVRLILAAPDLYDALETCLAALNPHIVHNISAGIAREQAEAALAKARGAQ